MKTKKCKICGIEKSISEFHKQRRGKFGVRTICKQCSQSENTKKKLSVPKGFKLCSNCDKIKSVNEFCSSTKYSDGLRNQCKECDKEYRIKNKEKIKQYKINHKEESQEYQKEYWKIYREGNRKKLSQYKKDYWQENKEKLLQYKKDYYQENKEIIQEQHKQYYLENKDYLSQKKKEYFEKNRDRLLKARREWERNQHKNNPNFKLAKMLRHRLNLALNGNLRVDKTLNLLGCSIEEFKKHLESQFKEGMNWKNHGRKGWHIDHRIPCIKFDLSKESEQRKCFFYQNLQPLWWHENLSKGSKC